MVKVDIISGFLGAGKTTLIKKFLKNCDNEKMVLIENEFGKIPIDGDLVKRDGFDVFEITSGCICCTLKKDFRDSFDKILQEFSPDRIIIEPTGINVLSEILTLLSEENFKDKLKINSVITVIDGMNYLDHIEAFGEFFRDQIMNANTIVISKVQYINDETLEKVITSLKELNSRAVILENNWDNLKFEDIKNLFNGRIQWNLEDIFKEKIEEANNLQFTSLSLTTLKIFNINSLKEALDKLCNGDYGRILRAKGFLKGQEHMLEFSYANGTYEVNKSTYDSIGKLCIIGLELNNKRLKELFKEKIKLKRINEV